MLLPDGSGTGHRRTIWVLGAITLIGMGGVGSVLIRNVQQRPLGRVVLGIGDFSEQLLFGSFLGIAFAAAGWYLLKRPRMSSVRLRYSDLLRPFIRHRADRIMIALCAGIGEELLFRGALQYWLGVPITALLFVAIHGYLDPRDKRLLLYGTYLTLFMVIVGYWAGWKGLLAPMAAHAWFDLWLLERMAGDPSDRDH
ncbi:MAG: CPBP family intramembrane metalloprotease [Flavobacteriales bacterium]|nr:CPBP family intramembrane metalloprotease [Flavobacteriales bacterium]